MNSFDLFWNKKKLATSTQQAVVDFFTKNGASVTAKEAVFKETADPFDFYGLALLRLNTKKNSSAIVVGSTQADFEQKFHELLPSAEPKTMETELLRAIYAAIDPELKFNQINMDPKSILCIPKKQLFGWDKFQVQRTMQFTLTTAKGDLSFEIPIFDSAFHESKMIEFYGFPEKTRIMVVDDSATTRKLSRHLLACIGYQNIDECVDGLAALNKLKGSNPPFEFVVADWHMPNMSGIDLLRQLRADNVFCTLPVILVTGERNTEEITTAVKVGVSGYVIKPFDGEAIYKAMKKAHNWMLVKTAPKKAA